MKVKCPICNGKGRIRIQYDGVMLYHNPHTGENFPHETCSGCNGTGIQKV